MARKRKPRAKPRRPARREGEAKRDATRRTLLERALELFQKRGVEATTMRDIARAAGLSLGAAYYYFPSKEALVFAFYEENQARVEELAITATGSVRERLGAIFHGKLDSIRSQRAMLASIIPHLVNPGDPLSAFSAQTRGVRARSIEVFERALDGAVPPHALAVVANALWLLQLACMLVYIHDDSPNEARTHGLVDDGLDMLVPMFSLLATPMGAALCDRVTTSLTRAGIWSAPEPS
jgi:AcrR family transcriptional regulator